MGAVGRRRGKGVHNVIVSSKFEQEQHIESWVYRHTDVFLALIRLRQVSNGYLQNVAYAHAHTHI